MSGGSYNYTCYRFEEEYSGRLYDAELNEMAEDFFKVLHDVEWWKSSDIEEDNYRKTVHEFKEKWFKGSREERLKKIINEECERLRTELLNIV